MFREFAAARARRIYDASMGMYVAWHTARLTLEAKANGKLPSLASQMPTVDRHVPASPQQMINVVGTLSEQYGTRIRKVRVHRVPPKAK